MIASIATQRPAFHALNVNVPVGHTQVFVASDYAGTVTTVTRVNTSYWAVTTREIKGAFSNPVVGVSAHVWLDPAAGRYVADYPTTSGDFGAVEVSRCHDLRAALGVAIWSTTERGHALGRW